MPELARVSEHRQRLAGVRVLVPRPRERAEQICFLLEDEGAEVLAIPLLELEPPGDPRPLRAAAELLRKGNRVCHVRVRVTQDGLLVAEGRGVYNIHRERRG